jgi:uncharacterized membrane protein
MPTNPFCRIYAPNGVGALTRQCRAQKFIVECLVYAVTFEHKSYSRDSLSARMNCLVRVRRLLDRKVRMSTCRSWPRLQNGTAFFASTSLFAIGDALALLRAGNDAATC